MGWVRHSSTRGMKFERMCPVCGTRFETNDPTKTYCSLIHQMDDSQRRQTALRRWRRAVRLYGYENRPSSVERTNKGVRPTKHSKAA
jgi:hypothetical protein